MLDSHYFLLYFIFLKIMIEFVQLKVDHLNLFFFFPSFFLFSFLNRDGISLGSSAGLELNM